jgi:hypothetical protein
MSGKEVELNLKDLNLKDLYKGKEWDEERGCWYAKRFVGDSLDLGQLASKHPNMVRFVACTFALKVTAARKETAGKEVFQTSPWFEDCTFEVAPDFQDAVFETNFGLRRCTISASAVNGEAAKVFFNDARFKGLFCAEGLNTKADLEFERTDFASDVWLKSGEFENKPYRTQLASVTFADVKVAGEVTLEGATTGSLKFTNSSCERLLLNRLVSSGPVGVHTCDIRGRLNLDSLTSPPASIDAKPPLTPSPAPVDAKLPPAPSPDRPAGVDVTLDATTAGSCSLDDANVAVFNAITLKISGQMTCCRARFKSATLYECQVGLLAKFVGVTFEGNADFSRATFGGQIDFSPFSPKSGLKQGTAFGGTVDFTGARLAAGLQWGGTPVNKLKADFASIGGELNLEMATDVSLACANVGSIKFGATPPAALNLQACTYGYAELPDCPEEKWWKNFFKKNEKGRGKFLTALCNGMKPFARQPFVYLATVLEKSGEMASARVVQIQKHRIERQRAAGSWNLVEIPLRVLRSIWAGVFNYGYGGLRAVAAFVGVLVVALLVLHCAGSFEPRDSKSPSPYDCSSVTIAQTSLYIASELLPGDVLPEVPCKPRLAAGPYLGCTVLWIAKYVVGPLALGTVVGFFKKIDK